MIKNERSLLLTVTLQTEFTEALVRVQGIHFTSVNLMARAAAHLPFTDRVTGR